MVLDKMKDILVEQLECNPEDITMESLLVDDLGPTVWTPSTS